MAYGGEWLTILRDLWALPRHKGEASLVKSPFFATHKSTMCLQERYLVQANLGGYATTPDPVRQPHLLSLLQGGSLMNAFNTTSLQPNPLALLL